MRILALEPYYGGSHKAFLDGWITRSRHSWTVMSLPARKWKWRMRHAAITMAGQVAQAVGDGMRWDLVLCSDMLNLAEFLGLAPAEVQELPALAYFHENQLTYPVVHAREYDYHFAFSNMTTALAADCVWFNSAYNRDSFLEALHSFLKRMPDHQPTESVELIRAKSHIRYPGIDQFPSRDARAPGITHLLWAARWEYDKAPEVFFEALEKLDERGVDFRVSVIGGGAARKMPPVFEEARRCLAGKILNWGYVEDRDTYAGILGTADIVVSTAQHEFFGVSVLEAVAAGAYPLVPNRLSYPEVLGDEDCRGRGSFFYEGGASELAARLEVVTDRAANGTLWEGDPEQARRLASRFYWEDSVGAWDSELETLAG